MAKDYKALWRASAAVIRNKMQEIIRLQDALNLADMENEGLMFYIAGKGSPEWREFVKAEVLNRCEQKSHG